jgi:hypothetical protein
LTEFGFDGDRLSRNSVKPRRNREQFLICTLRDWKQINLARG